jgi:predicted amidohydrolase
LPGAYGCTNLSTSAPDQGETSSATHDGDACSLIVAAVSSESRIRNVEFNVSRIEHWARKAAEAGAELVLFPEAGISCWWQSREVRALAEPLDGPSIQRLIRLADELDVVLAVGMTEKNGDQAHITHVVLDGDGVIGYHRKTRVAPGEERTWDPGNDANVFEVQGVRIGIAICYESVHPETCRELKAGGAQLILAPYANGTDPNELLIGKRRYTYARAVENHVWYVACDATPHNEDRSLRPGAAYIISPEGELVALSPLDGDGEAMVVYPIPICPGE